MSTKQKLSRNQQSMLKRVKPSWVEVAVTMSDEPEARLFNGAEDWSGERIHYGTFRSLVDAGLVTATDHGRNRAGQRVSLYRAAEQ